MPLTEVSSLLTPAWWVGLAASSILVLVWLAANRLQPDFGVALPSEAQEPGGPARAREGRSKMALEGTIKDFGLPDIFQLIGLQRKTGLLTLTNEKDAETVTVTFENGMVVMADSSANRLEDRLGNVLVKQGKVTRERLDEALGVQKQTLQRLGHILSSGSTITTKDLRDALQVQVSQIVFRVFRWRDGRYHFAPADTCRLRPRELRPHERGLHPDGRDPDGGRVAHHREEDPLLRHRLPACRRPLAHRGRARAGPDDSGEIRRGAPAASGRIRLSPDEDRVFRKVDGVRTVQAIIDGTGAAEFDVCRTLFDFLNRNLIAPEGRGETPALEEAEEERSASSVPGYAVAALVLSLAGAGLAARHGSPFLVAGRPPVVEQAWAVVRDGVTWSRLARLDQAIQAWQATYETPPQTLEELVGAGLVDRQLPPRSRAPAIPLRDRPGRVSAQWRGRRRANAPGGRPGPPGGDTLAGVRPRASWSGSGWRVSPRGDGRPPR